MFDIGIGEVFVMLVVALLVFGPDRLPVMAKQAASFVRDLRTMVANARRDLSGSMGDLGIDEDDLKTLSDLRNPRSFVRKKVLDGVDVDLGLDDLGLDDEPKRGRAGNNGAAKKNGTSKNGSATRTAQRSGSSAGNGSASTAKPGTDGSETTSADAADASVAETASPADSSSGEPPAAESAQAPASVGAGSGEVSAAVPGSSPEPATQAPRFDSDAT